MASPNRSSTDALVDHLRQTLGARSEDPSSVLLHDRRVEARVADFSILRPHLPAPLARAVRDAGVQQLYAHQVEAVTSLRDRHNVVLTSATASGKSLAFNLPTLERLLLDSTAHALYLYPTKALIADQRRALEALLAHIDAPRPPTVGVLTGDSTREERARLIERPPSILLANPDILHRSLLPAHRRWQGFLSRLEIVVLDELHAYRGVFGSHVALVMRRLRRLAGHFGAQPSFLAASATIGNAVELAEQVVGLPFQLIAGDGSGAGPRRFLFWRPPLRGTLEANEHESALGEAASIFAEALRAGHSGILFGRTRMAVERMLLDVRAMVGPSVADQVSAYKSGYSPHERARIEAALRAGRLKGVVATNALELGIDIGLLDVAVLAGYPGSVMSFWQQAGRVGRRVDREALVVMVGSDDALDQYHLEHPQSFFEQSIEHAVVDPGSPSILLSHLLCAAHERPLTADDLSLFPTSAERLLEKLAADRFVSQGPPWRYDAEGLPHADVSLRGTSREPYTLHTPHGDLGTAEPPIVYRECHPGAVYLHNGRAFRVEALDARTRVVRLRTESPGLRTDPLGEVTVLPSGDSLATRSLTIGDQAFAVTIGPLRVQETIAGYREHAPRRAAAYCALDTPLEFVLDTVGLWLDIPPQLEPDVPSLHAFEHGLVNALPIVLLCDRRNVGATHTHDAREGRSRVYLYDLCEGGIGLAEKAFHLLESVLTGAATLLGDCPCQDGCPNCVHLAGCALANADLDKVGGRALLQGRAVRAARTLRQLEDGGSQRRTPRAGPDRQARLRRIAESDLRERLSDVPMQVGDLMEQSGEGLVVVLAIGPERIRVRNLLSGEEQSVERGLLRVPGGR